MTVALEEWSRHREALRADLTTLTGATNQAVAGPRAAAVEWLLDVTARSAPAPADDVTGRHRRVIRRWLGETEAALGRPTISSFRDRTYLLNRRTAALAWALETTEPRNQP